MILEFKKGGYYLTVSYGTKVDRFVLWVPVENLQLLLLAFCLSIH